MLRLQIKLVRVEFLLKSDRNSISAKQIRLKATEFSNKIQENEQIIKSGGCEQSEILTFLVGGKLLVGEL